MWSTEEILFTCNFIDGKWQSYGRIYINVIFVKTFEQFKNKLGVISFRIDQFFIKWFHNFFVFLVANNRFTKLTEKQPRNLLIFYSNSNQRIFLKEFLLVFLLLFQVKNVFWFRNFYWRTLMIECENSMIFLLKILLKTYEMNKIWINRQSKTIF